LELCSPAAMAGVLWSGGREQKSSRARAGRVVRVREKTKAEAVALLACPVEERSSEHGGARASLVGHGGRESERERRVRGRMREHWLGLPLLNVVWGY